jgi:hypothetical protein
MRPENVENAPAPGAKAGAGPAGAGSPAGSPEAGAPIGGMSPAARLRRPTVRVEGSVLDELPLPAQILFRALLHIACKAASGSDIYAVWDLGEKPELVVRTNVGRLGVSWLDGALTIDFTKKKEGFFFKKRCEVEMEREVAEKVVEILAETVILTAETLTVTLPSFLEKVFAGVERAGVGADG